MQYAILLAGMACIQTPPVLFMPLSLKLLRPLQPLDTLEPHVIFFFQIGPATVRLSESAAAAIGALAGERDAAAAEKARAAKAGYAAREKQASEATEREQREQRAADRASAEAVAAEAQAAAGAAEAAAAKAAAAEAAAHARFDALAAKVRAVELHALYFHVLRSYADHGSLKWGLPAPNTG